MIPSKESKAELVMSSHWWSKVCTMILEEA
jgi:hypothetical protein